MSFSDLPALPPLLHAEGNDYARRISDASARVMAQSPVSLDHAYGDDYWQKVDIYLPFPTPAPTASAVPVLCYVHGGAWMNGCKEWMGFMAPPLVDAPLIFVSVSHRLAPSVRMPQIVDDCFDALAWVHANIARFGGDPARIFVGGHSAGGHLAALMALRRDLARARGLPADVVKGCFPMSGVYDLTPAARGSAPLDAPIRQRIFDASTQAADWSPLHCVDGNTTPFYVSWGEHDFPRTLAQSRVFVDALARQPGAVTSDVFAGHTHFSVNEACGQPGNAWARRVRQRISDL